MTGTLKAHFDGHFLIPDEPVDLPVGCPLVVQVLRPERVEAESKPLAKLAELARTLPANPNAPPDGAAEHDYYLYGATKRP
jgi:hypothetical protein